MIKIESAGNFWIDLRRCFKGISSYLSCRNCLKSGNTKQYDDDEIISDNYSSGESESEFMSPFNDLDTEEKRKRLIFLWSKAIGRSIGAALIIDKLKY